MVSLLQCGICCLLRIETPIYVLNTSIDPLHSMSSGPTAAPGADFEKREITHRGTTVAVRDGMTYTLQPAWTNSIWSIKQKKDTFPDYIYVSKERVFGDPCRLSLET